MTPVIIPCKKCSTEKKYKTSFLPVPIKFLFYCENETCRTPNGVILVFSAPNKLEVKGSFLMEDRPLPLVDLTNTEIIAPDEFTELIE